MARFGARISRGRPGWERSGEAVARVEPPTWSRITRMLVEAAFEEDLGAAGDLSARLLPDPQRVCRGRVTPRQAGVVCGLALGPLLAEAYRAKTGATIELVEVGVHDGDSCSAGAPIAEIRGAHAAVLSFERTLLNFVGRMSGVATLTARYVEAARCAGAARGHESHGPLVVDTRKTIPGWRELDKYSVRAGGGANHRMGLYDAVLIKDNHLAGLPLASLGEALGAMITRADRAAAFVEVEVDSLAQLDAVLPVAGVDVILLDNFSTDELAEAVRRRDALGARTRVLLEASGGVTLANIRAVATTGVDRIAVGAITHSAVQLDVGLDF